MSSSNDKMQIGRMSNSDEGEKPVAESSTSASKGKRTRPDTTLSSDDCVQPRRKRPKGFQAVNATLHPGLEPIEIEVTEKLHNLSKWKAALGGGLTIETLIQPTRVEGRIKLVRCLLQENPRDNRSYQVTNIGWYRNNGGYWTFKLRDQNNPQASELSIGSKVMSIKMCPTRADARMVAQAWCRFVDRLPMAVPQFRPMMALTKFIEAAALAVTFPDFDWASNPYESTGVPGAGITFNEGPQGVSLMNFDCKAWSLDGDHADNRMGTRLNPLRMDMSEEKVIPGIPEGQIYQIPDVAIPSSVSPADRPKYAKAIQMARWIQWNLNGAIGNKSALRYLRDQIMLPLLVDGLEGADGKIYSSTKTSTGAYGNGPLWRIFFEKGKRQTNVSPPTVVTGDVRGKIPAIRLVGESRTRAAWVLSKILNKFLAGAGILNAWQAGCFAADLLNTGQITSDDIKIGYSACPDELRSTMALICMSCLKQILCEDSVVDDSGLTVCLNCRQKTRKDDAHHGSVDRMWSNLRIRADTDVRRPEDRKVYRDRLCQHILQFFDAATGTWRDAYSCRRRPEVSPVLGHHPFIASAEAVWPFIAVDGETFYHHPKNVVVTADYANKMKWTYVPAILGLLRESQEERKKPDTVTHQNHLDRFDHIYALGKQYPFERKDRIGKAMSEEDFKDTWVPKWTAAVVTTQETMKVSWSKEHTGQNAEWQPEDITNIEQIIDEMELDLKRKVRRSKDGVPWFWIEKHMPKNWTWYELWRLFAARFERMKWYCNKYWETLDNPMTIMLECAHQFLKHGGRDLFLGLEMTILSRHPLCFAVGHDEHGKQMRTGWRNGRPKSFKDDYVPGQCNILFETQTSNYGKWNYSRETYQEILDDILELHTDTEWYHPPSSIPALQSQDWLAYVADDLVEEVDFFSENEADDDDDDDAID